MRSDSCIRCSPVQVAELFCATYRESNCRAMFPIADMIAFVEVFEIERPMMRRRKFLTLAGGAAVVWPLSVGAQQPAMPVVGFLRSTPSAPFMHLVAAFQQGLRDEGFIEGQNVSIEYRSADNQLDRLPGLATDLVRHQVAVIVGNTPAAEAAKAATQTIPIVFVTGEDPVTTGLVDSLNRPSGNLTGVVFFASGHLGTKRVELLHELVPRELSLPF